MKYALILLVLALIPAVSAECYFSQDGRCTGTCSGGICTYVPLISRPGGSCTCITTTSTTLQSYCYYDTGRRMCAGVCRLGQCVEVAPYQCSCLSPTTTTEAKILRGDNLRLEPEGMRVGCLQAGFLHVRRRAGWQRILHL